MSLSVPIKYFKIDVEENINIQRLRMITGSSFIVNVTLYQGDTIIDLTDANDISLVYSDNSLFEETITGASSALTPGVCTFNFTPANTNHSGVFQFFVKVSEIGGNTIIFPYGQLILMES